LQAQPVEQQVAALDPAHASPQDAIPIPALAPPQGGMAPSDCLDLYSRDNPKELRPDKLLGALWRSTSLYHQVGTKGRNTPFSNRVVASVAEAIEASLAASEQGIDAYFACAEFGDPSSRRAANARQAWCLWLDIDCGADKAAAGKGYGSAAQARLAVNQFCAAAELPPPTHWVLSGAGLHLYWCVDTPIEREVWTEHAGYLKGLTTALGLLADQTRTADIASVLRVPGTLNHKYAPARPVVLEVADPPLERDSLLQRISQAHVHHCVAPEAQQKPASGSGQADSFGPSDLTRVASALGSLDPDCDEPTWTLRIMAPLAHEARAFPEQERALYGLARAFSSGDLQGKPSVKWNTPTTAGGSTGAQVFDAVWARFLTQEFAGSPTTLGTIYHDAKQAGWTTAMAQHVEVAASPEASGGNHRHHASSSARRTPDAESNVQKAPSTPAANDSQCHSEPPIEVGAVARRAQLADADLPHHRASTSDADPSERDQQVIESNPATALPRSRSQKWCLDQPLGVANLPHQPTGKGRQAPMTIQNLLHLLDEYGITVRYNVIKKKIDIRIPDHRGTPDNFDTSALTVIENLARMNDLQAGPVTSYLATIGDQNAYNPAAEWITSKPWDGVDRLKAFYDTLTAADDYPKAMKEQLMYRWALSAVAAALMAEGFHSRGVLTLQGDQGLGKTSWIRALVSDLELSRELIKGDQHLDVSDKDTLLTALTHWIVELSELESTMRKDIPRTKAFLTSNCDKLRRPYGAANSNYQRRTVFTATVNDENFLIDPTGNSRFWTIPVVQINYQHGIDMQQLFAQLAVDFHAGEQWWLTPSEDALLQDLNKSHRAASVLRDRVSLRIDSSRVANDNVKALTSTELMHVLGVERPSNGDFKELKGILKEFKVRRVRIQGTEKYKFPFKPDPGDRPGHQPDLGGQCDDIPF
jgi:hypothetical protein